MAVVLRDGNGPALSAGVIRGLGVIADHDYVLELVQLTNTEECPAQRAGVLAVEDGFEMQMAARGPSRSANPGNDLAHLHGIPCPDRDSLQVVVRGDQPVAVVYFHTVSAAPGVPAGGPDHAGVGRVDPGAAACSEVLAQVEVAARTGDRADPVPERRA